MENWLGNVVGKEQSSAQSFGTIPCKSGRPGAEVRVPWDRQGQEKGELEYNLASGHTLLGAEVTNWKKNRKQKAQ